MWEKRNIYILSGFLWGLVSSPVILSEVVREFLYQRFGPSIGLFFFITPIGWTAFITNDRILAAILAPILGALAGFVVYLISR